MARWLGVNLLITAIFSVSFSSSSASVESTATKKDHGLVTTISKQHQSSAWERLRDIFRRKKGTGGTRDGEFCLISTLGEKIWSDRPLFVWQGTVKQIEVRNFVDNKLIWTHELTEKEQIQQSLLYQGPALQPGQEYDYWVTYETTDEGKTITKTTADPIPLEVMEAQERIRIEADLAPLEIPNLTVEERALQRANYFVEQELWSDAVREIFLVPNPSSDWARDIEKLRKKVFLGSIFWCG